MQLIQNGSQNHDNDQQLVRAILREDLYCFIQAAFPTVSPGASFAPNWHIEAIAFALTRVLNGSSA
jgi:hypothetical protein